MPWHQEPDAALASAERLGEAELLGYFRTALRPRPPI
jgi:hypothetical protein